MSDFYDQVESLLTTKSANELKAFVMKIAEKIPESTREMFLTVLENKQVIVSKDASSDFKPEKILNRIRELLEEVEDYDIEAYYNDDWYDHDSDYTIDSDDGFCDEFYFCYSGAVSLVEHGLFVDAAEAFAMLLQTIEEFDAFNESNDCGPFYFETFISEGMLDVDMKKMRVLRVYSALMVPVENMDELFCEAYNMLRRISNKLMFSDFLHAGSEMVPNADAVVKNWISFLFSQPPDVASPMINEAAKLSGNGESVIEIMEDFVKTSGAKEPKAYIDLCELYVENGQVGLDQIISVAEDGLRNTDVNTRNRDRLAKLLAQHAKKTGNQTAYRYAITECFFSATNLQNYLPLLCLGERGTIEAAMQHLDETEKPGVSRYMTSSDTNYYAIHFLNQDYDLVFKAISSDDAALGWSSSLKGMTIPLFIGLLAGFEKRALIIQKIIGEALHYENAAFVYECLRDNIGAYTADQEQTWYARCVSEVSGRTDAIVSGKHRGSYFKAAQLLVAIAEMRLYRKEEMPFGIIQSFVTKYPRHTAFREELRRAIAEAKLTGLKV